MTRLGVGLVRKLKKAGKTLDDVSDLKANLIDFAVADAYLNGGHALGLDFSKLPYEYEYKMQVDKGSGLTNGCAQAVLKEAGVVVWWEGYNGGLETRDHSNKLVKNDLDGRLHMAEGYTVVDMGDIDDTRYKGLESSKADEAIWAPIRAANELAATEALEELITSSPELNEAELLCRDIFTSAMHNGSKEFYGLHNYKVYEEAQQLVMAGSFGPSFVDAFVARNVEGVHECMVSNEALLQAEAQVKADAAQVKADAAEERERVRKESERIHAEQEKRRAKIKANNLIKLEAYAGKYMGRNVDSSGYLEDVKSDYFKVSQLVKQLDYKVKGVVLYDPASLHRFMGSMEYLHYYTLKNLRGSKAGARSIVETHEFDEAYSGASDVLKAKVDKHSEDPQEYLGVPQDVIVAYRELVELLAIVSELLPNHTVRLYGDNRRLFIEDYNDSARDILKAHGYKYTVRYGCSMQYGKKSFGRLYPLPDDVDVAKFVKAHQLDHRHILCDMDGRIVVWLPRCYDGTEVAREITGYHNRCSHTRTYHRGTIFEFTTWIPPQLVTETREIK